MRFNTLDGLRGSAAILVLFYHLGAASPIAVPAGYLSVDLFFVLSGFVIALVYEERLRAGLSLREFSVQRIIRIYPMAVLGAAIGVLLSGKFLLSLLLVPDLSGIGTSSVLFPANVPLWSLVYELASNFAFALLAVRVGWRGLAAMIAASAVLLAIGMSRETLIDLGPYWSTTGFGLARLVFDFSVGVAMHRLHVRFAIRRRQTYLAWLPPVSLAVVVTQLPHTNLVVDFLGVFVLVPAIVWLGTVWDAPRARLFIELGALSYPLYCIHGVIIQATDAVGGPPTYLWLPLIVAAWWLNSRVDVPLRQWLMRGWNQRQAALAPT